MLGLVLSPFPSGVCRPGEKVHDTDHPSHNHVIKLRGKIWVGPGEDADLVKMDFPTLPVVTVKLKLK